MKKVLKEHYPINNFSLGKIYKILELKLLHLYFYQN